MGLLAFWGFTALHIYLGIAVATLLWVKIICFVVASVCFVVGIAVAQEG